MQQVSKRLDRLISQIREIQRPRMNGRGAADMLLIRYLSLLSTSANPTFHLAFLPLRLSLLSSLAAAKTR